MTGRLGAVLAVLAACLTFDAAAQTRGGRDAPSAPHYLSLKSDTVHMRVGPGTQHPIEWVLQRRYMPVRVIAEIEQWRRVVDATGTTGWVHQQTLSSRRYAMVMGEVRSLRRAAQPDAVAIARLEPGVIGRLVECAGAWCRMEAGGFRGWIARTEIWGADPGETFK